MKVILLAILLVALALAGLAVRILLKKDGQFPSIHIGGNKHLKERGISCATSYDKMEQAKAKKELRFKEIKLREDGDSL